MNRRSDREHAGCIRGAMAGWSGVLARLAAGFVFVALAATPAGFVFVALAATPAASDDSLPDHTSSLVGPAKPSAMPASVLQIGASQGAQGDLIRDALVLDFAGYHLGAQDVVRALRARNPADPLGALVEVEHRFWPQLYDVGPIRDDPALVDSIQSALALAKAAHEADPDDIEARALYGRALIHDARRLALDGYLLKAGSQSESARKLLETAVETRPADHDSRYLLGNYYYWAGVLPSYLKYVNWLWFVPQGDTGEGVEMLRQVSRSPSPYAPSAQVMLSVISSHHAPTDFADAYSRLVPLHERYPKNVLIHHELVDLLFKMERWDELDPLLSDMEARVGEPQPIRAYGLVAELWRARVALHRGEADEAQRRLDVLRSNGADLPNWSHSWADVLQGQIHDLHGRRDEAKQAYRAALGREGLEESQRARRMAKAGLEAPFDPARFEHPLLLTGD